MLQWYFRLAMTTSFHVHSTSLCTSHGYWYWHSWMFTVFLFCVQCTVILADWWVGSYDCRQYTTVCEVQMRNVYCAGWWSCAVGTLLIPHWLKTRLGLLTVFCDRQIKAWCNWTCRSNMWQQTMRLPAYCQNVRRWRNRNQSEYWTKVCMCGCVKFLILDPCKGKLGKYSSWIGLN